MVIAGGISIKPKTPRQPYYGVFSKSTFSPKVESEGSKFEPILKVAEKIPCQTGLVVSKPFAMKSSPSSELSQTAKQKLPGLNPVVSISSMDSMKEKTTDVGNSTSGRLKVMIKNRPNFKGPTTMIAGNKPKAPKPDVIISSTSAASEKGKKASIQGT